MTLDEAITHAREVAEKQRKDNDNCEYKAEYGCKGCADYYSKPCIECAEEHEPSYEDTYIGDDCVDCFTEDTNTYTCEKCGKKFTMYGYQAGWKYHTETIDGEATEEEIEDLQE